MMKAINFFLRLTRAGFLDNINDFIPIPNPYQIVTSSGIVPIKNQTLSSFFVSYRMEKLYKKKLQKKAFYSDSVQQAVFYCNLLVRCSKNIYSTMFYSKVGYIKKLLPRGRKHV